MEMQMESALLPKMKKWAKEFLTWVLVGFGSLFFAALVLLVWYSTLKMLGDVCVDAAVTVLGAALGGMAMSGEKPSADGDGAAVVRYPVCADTYGWGPGYAPANAHLCRPENANHWLTADELKAVKLLDDETDLEECYPTKCDENGNIAGDGADGEQPINGFPPENDIRSARELQEVL